MPVVTHVMLICGIYYSGLEVLNDYRVSFFVLPQVACRAH